MNKIVYASFSFFLFMLMSCASIQKDVYKSEPDITMTESLKDIEEAVILQDGKYFSDKNSMFSEAESTALIAQIDMILSSQYPDENTIARLYAFKGRVFLASGQKQNAQKILAEAKKINPGDPQVIILDYRLNKTGTLDTMFNVSDDSVPLLIEKALTYYQQSLFAEAVSSFDAAFVTAAPVYPQAYGIIRNTAWSLKDVKNTAGNTKQTDALIALKEITALQMIQLISDYSNKLQNIDGSEKSSSKEKFNQLVVLKIFDSVSALPAQASDPIGADQKITRILCARILWNLYCLRSGRQTAAAPYSKAYRDQLFGASPIPDISLSSEDFDAVLGCVENEIMELPDGVHFDPDKRITAAEMIDWIQKI